MDAVTAIGLVITVVKTAIEVAPVVVQGIQDMKSFAVALFQKFTGKDITPEQRVELEAQIDNLHAQFQAPIPPEDQQ